MKAFCTEEGSALDSRSAEGGKEICSFHRSRELVDTASDSSPRWTEAARDFR